MKALVAIIFSFLLLGLAGEARAHSGALDSAGSNEVINVYDATRYDTALRVSMRRWNNLDDQFGRRGVRFRMVRNLHAAELLVRDVPSMRWCGTTHFYEPGIDLIRLNVECYRKMTGTGRIKVTLHELGHSQGYRHHACTPRWQKRTVMVGSCIIKRSWPGKHDVRTYYRRWVD